MQENPNISFIDLINIKRSDPSYHNANWMVILKKNNMDYRNKRLLQEYIDESKKFHNLLRKKLKQHIFRLSKKKISLMVTIGEASFPQDGRTSEELIRTADRDLLKKKRACF